MARKLGKGIGPSQEELIADEWRRILNDSGITHTVQPWWQAPPHFFDRGSVEALLQPARRNLDAPYDLI